MTRWNRCLAQMGLLLSSFLASTAGASPNLVPNPSFESHDQCPSSIDLFTGQIHFASPWIRAGSTPDYFHSCGLISSVETPDNAFGSQCPYGDDCGGSALWGGYAGIVIFIQGCDFCREYIQVPLISPLSSGLKYRVQFYASLAEYSKYAVDRLGAYLSVGEVVPNDDVLPFVPQVENPQGVMLDDKGGWTKITGKFQAAGGEDHLVLGNFYEDAETGTELQSSGGTFDHAYYYVDMVSVKRADITDIALPPGGGGGGGDLWVTTLTGGTPNSPAWLYCSGDLSTSEINGHTFDVGPDAHVLAQTTTDGNGEARFEWSWQEAARFAGPDDRVHLEARVDDPANGDTTDSDEISLSTVVTAVSPGMLTTHLGAVAIAPNPFNPRTVISYELLKPGPVQVALFDARGRMVRALESAASKPAGHYRLPWDGTDDQRRSVGAGVYRVQIVTAGEQQTRPLVLVK